MRTDPPPGPPTGWTPTHFTAAGRSYPVYRRGSGPGVVVIPELPGPTPRVFDFADEVADAGFSVAVPHLFGRVGEPPTAGAFLRTGLRLCVSREFTVLVAGTTTPVAGWLRALCRQLHAEAAGPGVGVVGMCFTGGFALAAMVDPSVLAPVVAQQSAPLPLGTRRATDLQLSREDLATIHRRAEAGCPVMGVWYKNDALVGRRFETLEALLGNAFRAVPLAGRKHSTLTEHRDEGAVRQVIDFLCGQLLAGPSPSANDPAAPGLSPNDPAAPQDS